jgi:2-C-methyl-D-erythritol 2,4-cyclodiphosphate synthase
MTRVGFGYDIHRLVEGRKLVLGGIDVPFPKGLLGHSDADVLLHAIADALLGAAALGDIGKHFPDTDMSLKNISSLILLERVAGILREKKITIDNIDSTLVLQQPLIAPYVDQMRNAIAGALQISADRISVKATTNEGLGFIGRQEGIAAFAVASVQKS